MLTPGNLARVLEREEDARARPLVRLHLQDRLPVDEDVALGDRVVRVAGDRLGHRGLAGAVRPHDRMDFSGIDRQGHAFDDFLVSSGDVQVLDFE